MENQNKELNVNIPEGTKELTLRQGDAPKVNNPRSGVNIFGTLRVPRERITKLPREVEAIKNKYGDTKLANSYIEVDRTNGIIRLIEDAGMDDSNTFQGQLINDSRFKNFGINTGKEYTTHELADFIKMNRSFFETKDVAMKLIAELRNFKAKVDKQMEHSDNTRGDKRFLIAQAVDSNIPDTFKLDIPIYKGVDRKKIEVEIAIDSGDFSCKLVSPDAADFMEEIKDELIDDELKAIRELSPYLQIFES